MKYFTNIENTGKQDAKTKKVAKYIFLKYYKNITE